jgi:hypothetical protein
MISTACTCLRELASAKARWVMDTIFSGDE